MNKTLAALQNIRGLRRPILVVLALIVAMPLISLWATYQISELGDRIATIDDARLGLSRTLRYALDEETGLRGYLDTRRQRFLEPYLSARPRMDVELLRLPTEFASAGLYRVLPKLNDFSRLHDAWHADVASPLLANPGRSDALARQEAGIRLIDKMRADVQVIHAEALAFTREQSHRMFDVMLISGFLAVFWIGIVGAFTVLIERRSLQRETELVMSLIEQRESMERLSDWRSRLLAMLAHDFKSQLAVVIGAAHLLEDFPQRRGDPQLLASVRSAGYTLAEMADNAILLARAQERRLMLQRTAFDISEIVGSVVQRYGSQREVNVYSETPTAMIDGDHSYVTRVMDNIIGNAVKYSEQPIDVHIGDNDREQVRVSVTDRGAGISEQDLPHIFEEFWRSESAVWSKNGSGVGLFIVKQIMEAHGGSIRVESELGKGTTVTLRFPRAMAAFCPPLPERVKTAT